MQVESETDAPDTVKTVFQKGYKIKSLSAVIMAQKPKLLPHIPSISKNLSSVLGIDIEEVGFDIDFKDGFSNLRGAYMEVSQKYFDKGENIPDEKFFAVSQYNTWIELMYNQNQDDILNYIYFPLQN